MAAERLPVRKLREVIRMRLQGNQWIREWVQGFTNLSTL
jgi:hypothetical protein